jgi:hypothetical protein
VRLSKIVISLALASGLAGTAAISPAVASTNHETSVLCTQVWQYTVIANGDMTNAESGGSIVGTAQVWDTFNVRIQGSPRYYGYNVRNATWGWILSSKLSYNGVTWCE